MPQIGSKTSVIGALLHKLRHEYGFRTSRNESLAHATGSAADLKRGALALHQKYFWSSMAHKSYSYKSPRKQAERDEFLLAKRKSRPVVAYVSLLLAGLLMLWVLTSPRLVLGQSSAHANKQTLPSASKQPNHSLANAAANAAAAVPAKQGETADVRMSDAQRQKLREQIIESSKLKLQTKSVVPSNHTQSNSQGGSAQQRS